MAHKKFKATFKAAIEAAEALELALAELQEAWDPEFTDLDSIADQVQEDLWEVAEAYEDEFDVELGLKG